MIDYLQENKILVVGIRIDQDNDWTQLIEEFSINIELERKLASIIFFKIGKDHRPELFNQISSLVQ